MTANPTCATCNGTGVIESENWHEVEVRDCPTCATPEPQTVTITKPRMTEKDVQKGIRDLLENLGFQCFHNVYALGSDPAWPDLVGVSADGLLVAVECKGPKGAVRKGQAEWLDRFREVPGCVFAEIVGPAQGKHWVGYDWARGAIQGAVEMRRYVMDVQQ